jgi:hypothetical protein
MAIVFPPFPGSTGRLGRERRAGQSRHGSGRGIRHRPRGAGNAAKPNSTRQKCRFSLAIVIGTRYVAA